MDEIIKNPVTTDIATASLEHLTGPSRGTASWWAGTTVDVSLDNSHMIHIAGPDGKLPQDTLVARLHFSDGRYEIEALNDNILWINGKQILTRQLEQFDLIEFGDTGPLCRYRYYQQGSRIQKSLGDMVSDCIDYTRVSRKPTPVRLGGAIRDFFRDFAFETTLFFRFTVIVAIVTLFVTVFYQNRANVRLQQQAEISADQLESFSRTLTRTKLDALRLSDLDTLRQELDHSLTAAAERLDLLEKRSAASTRVIAKSTRSIVFLQGAYGFRDTASDRMLRYKFNDDGRPLYSYQGEPLLTLEGDGELAERQFTGTAFVVSSDGALLTNRHVAKPWEDDTNLETMFEQGMEPVFIKFVGHLPYIDKPFPVRLLKASDESDLAVLLCSDVISNLQHLSLSDKPLKPGDEVIVMGYPTGLRSMLARTGDTFLVELQKDEDLDFWAVAERLSKSGFIRPLSSRGIVGQLTASTVVYDADTTHGGSGGPVLDINGKVVAVNTAIIPEYGGSNFGVPVEQVRRLLVEVNLL